MFPARYELSPQIIYITSEIKRNTTKRQDGRFWNPEIAFKHTSTGKIDRKGKKKSFNVIRIVKQSFSFYSSVPNGGDTNCCSCLKLVWNTGLSKQGLG